MIFRAVVAVVAAVAVAAVGGVAWAQGSGHPHRHGAPFAGQEERALKSLSDEDIAELRRGGGWGLAKAVELNGAPGPTHLLELKDQIGLRPEQVVAVTALFEAMQRDAWAEGARLLALEAELDAGFLARTMDMAALVRLTGAIGESLGKLRLIHLAAHVTTPALLSATQIAEYNRLRGYDAGPCAQVPAGHDAAMWRRHNGCK